MSAWSELGATLGRWWTRPEIEEVNALGARATFERYPGVDDARAGATPWLQSLDGAWRFHLVERPADVAPRWVAPDFDDSEWAAITVPGVWTRQGHDHPHYTNIVMPWPGDPPDVPDRNPTGLYRTTFSRPRGWARRRTILEIGGAESTAAVFLNGAFVGICTDSRLRTEFDITDHLRAGENVLAVAVVRWSAATWIEDQDHWFHGGLHRSVVIRSAGASSIGDVTVSARYQPSDGAGVADVAVRVDGPSSGHVVRMTLEDARGRRLESKTSSISVLDRSHHLSEMADGYRHPGPLALGTFRVDAVDPWSHEKPARYRIFVELLDGSGEVIEATTVWTGFRSVEIRDRELLLNGHPLLIAGVNRHDHHQVTGKTQSPEELRDEVVAMKRAGMNAVRTAHYPPDPTFLDACDELGLWTILEANLESHARWAEVSNDPRYQAAFVTRVRRAIATHRNHPAIMAWSLGNESGYGPAHDAAAAWARHADPDRFVHYEGAIMRTWLHEPMAAEATPATDVICPMYPHVGDIVAWAQTTAGTKPLIMCEYSHAMGNSNGGLADYWAAIRAHHGLQGGFIWDWKDQGLEETAADGRRYWAYGGHYGDQPNDADFCCNGLVGPDGVPHPALEEHRRLVQPIAVEARDLRRGRFTIRNQRAWLDLSDLVLEISLKVDGRTISTVKPDIPAVPSGGQVELVVPLDRPSLVEGETAHIDFAFRLRRSTDWAARGHVIADQQFELPWSGRRRAPVLHRTAVERDGDTIRAGVLGIRIDPEQAVVSSVTDRGRPVIVDPIRLGMWRAPIDNDGPSVGPAAGITGVRPQWLAWGLDRLSLDPGGVTVRRVGDGVRAVLRRRWNGSIDGAEHLSRIEVLPEGVIRFDEEVVVPESWIDLPRVGVRFALERSLDRLHWLGRGPEETYPDRRTAPFGRWRSTVEEQLVPYVMPQHHGSHVDTTWAALTDRRGRGALLWLGGSTFDASIYSLENVAAAETLADLEPSDRIHVHVDGAMRGVGTGACGPDTTAIVRPGRHRFTWAMAPLRPGDDPGQVALAVAGLTS